MPTNAAGKNIRATGAEGATWPGDGFAVNVAAVPGGNIEPPLIDVQHSSAPE